MATQMPFQRRDILSANHTAGAAMEKQVSTTTGIRFTPEEYLRLERFAETKSEYFDGEIRRSLAERDQRQVLPDRDLVTGIED